MRGPWPRPLPRRTQHPRTRCRGAAVLDSLFRFLFKYSPLVFERGSIALSGRRALAVLLPLTLIVAGAVLWSYTRVGGKARRLDRVVLVALRLGVLAALAFCLLRPKLVISSLVPQQNFLGVLVDDSRSMRIADQDGGSRGAFATRELGTDTAALREALARRFQLRFFRFSSSAERTGDPGTLAFAGTRTDLAAAMDEAREELAGVPLAGLVVVSDGADNARAPLSQSLLTLRAARVPVFTVGVGRPAPDRDIELSRVEVPRTVLEGTSLVVDVVVSQAGYGGRRVPLYVEDGGRLVAQQEITLPRDGEPTPVRVRFTAERAGARRLRFRIPAQPGEAVAENNEQDALVRVREGREKVLYLEGEPRFEVKFLRRAVADDPNLQLVVLLRTAKDKFLRLDVDRPDELVSGFPKTREELFSYKALVLGSIEASFFTREQLQLIADFVSERGGGLLMIGGRHAFAEGGYAGTPLSDALPVELPAGGGSEDFFARMKVEPTRAGRAAAVTQLAATEDSSLARWKALPELSTVNPLDRLKPGATALLVGRGEGLPDEQVVLAAQRYGRGRAAALTAEDTWLWQMDASIAPDDMTHETFWRQMLRWLVADVPPPVEATVAAERVEPGEAVTLQATVADSAFVAVNGAAVVARVRAPSGAVTEVPMEWDVDRDGAYRARFTPTEAGVHEVAVEARRGAALLGGDTASFQAGPSAAEYFDAGMRAPLLERIAAETGGRFYTPATLASLPEDIRYVGSGTSRIEEKDLWDMPVVFLLLIVLAGAEWGWRRARGLA